MPDNKNIRLDRPVWEHLRSIKFEGEFNNYNEIFNTIFETLENKKIDIREYVKEEFDEPYEKGDEIRTVLVDKNVHRRLGYYKMLYMQATGATARGEGSVSISQIVEKLIRKYHEIG